MALTLFGTLFLVDACSANKRNHFNASLNLSPTIMSKESAGEREHSLMPVPTASPSSAHSPNKSATPHLTFSQSTFGLVTGTAAMIIADYAGSELEHSDLDSTYFDCAVQSEASLGVTVQFSGAKTNGKAVSAECTNRGASQNPILAECTFSALKSVQSVNVMVVKPATLDLIVEYLTNSLASCTPPLELIEEEAC